MEYQRLFSGGKYVPNCAGKPRACRGDYVIVLGPRVAPAPIRAETTRADVYEMEVT